MYAGRENIAKDARRRLVVAAGRDDAHERLVHRVPSCRSPLIRRMMRAMDGGIARMERRYTCFQIVKECWFVGCRCFWSRREVWGIDRSYGHSILVMSRACMALWSMKNWLGWVEIGSKLGSHWDRIGINLGSLWVPKLAVCGAGSAVFGFVIFAVFLSDAGPQIHARSPARLPLLGDLCLVVGRGCGRVGSGGAVLVRGGFIVVFVVGEDRGASCLCLEDLTLTTIRW